MKKVVDWIGKAYHWFWKDVLCRLEPFTSQFIRMAKKYPWFWILLLALPILAFGNSVYKREWLAAVIWFILAMVLSWLAYHLGGFL